MKTIEFNPDGKSTIITPEVSSRDEAVRNEMLVEALPLIIHKLKNKLTPVLGYTQILQSREPDEFTRERLTRIERNAAELTEALNFLKEYCRPAQADLRPGDINDVVEGLGPRWQAIASAAGAKVFLELEERLPALPLAAGRLRILLLSLAENAVSALKSKAAGKKEIRIATRNRGDSLTLAVRDNGCGMSEAEAANAWVPFFSKFSGHAGLGLVLCEKVISDHGGSISVASVPGESSEFTISFPLPACPQAKQNK